MCKVGLRMKYSAVRAIFESWYLTTCSEILYETSQSCSTISRLHVGQFSRFLEVFCYVNHMCKVGLRMKYSAIRAIFESRYLTTCSEILYETAQSCSTMSILHVGKFSRFLKIVWYVNQRCKVEFPKKKKKKISDRQKIWRFGIKIPDRQ